MLPMTVLLSMKSLVILNMKVHWLLYTGQSNLRDALKLMHASFFEWLNAHPGGLKLLVTLRDDLLSLLAIVCHQPLPRDPIQRVWDGPPPQHSGVINEAFQDSLSLYYQILIYPNSAGFLYT